MSERKSPLKQIPLGSAGESSNVRLNDVIAEKVTAWVVFVIMAAFWACWEWVSWLLHLQPHPIFCTIIAVVIFVLAVWNIRQARKETASIRLGIEGEKTVGQFLDALRAQGYQVFHDICENGYNIDHVLIGPTGVYAIETKTRSKPIKGIAEIIYDGQSILVNGHAPDRDPLTQATASAKRVCQILQQGTGIEVFVRPVVMFPGWFVRRTCKSPPVWVLNQQYLPAWLDHEDHSLGSSDIHLLSSALATYLRSSKG